MALLAPASQDGWAKRGHRKAFPKLQEPRGHRALRCANEQRGGFEAALPAALPVSQAPFGWGRALCCPTMLLF